MVSTPFEPSMYAKVEIANAMAVLGYKLEGHWEIEHFSDGQENPTIYNALFVEGL